jgi:hypothetical protein
MKIRHIKSLKLSKVAMVCFILIGIISVGFIVYNNSDKNGKLNADVTISNPIDQVNTVATPALTTQNSIDEYDFSIPELGIKIKIPYELVGLKYSIDNSAPWGPVAFLTTSSLEKVDVDSQCKEPGPLGAIWLVPNDPKTVRDSKVSNSKKIGKSYIAYQHPQGLCSNNPNTTSLQTTQIKLLQQVIDTIEDVK